MTTEQTANIVKVRYFSETTGGLSAREYTYFSEDKLNIGDTLIVPVKDRTSKAKVSAVDVPEAEIEAFKDKVKTIPAGVVIAPTESITTTAPPGPLSGVTGTVSPAGHVTITGPPTPDAAVEAYFTPPDTNEPETLPEEPPVTSIVQSPQPEVIIFALRERALSLLRYATERIVKSLPDAKTATEDLTIIRQSKKALEEKRKGYVAPLNDQVKLINDAFRQVSDPLNQADKLTSDKILAFTRELDRLRAEQEAINRQKMELARREAELNHGEVTIDTTPVEVIPEPGKRIRTEIGTATQRDNWKYEVVDIDLLPREYMTPDAALLNATAKKYHDQKKVAGVRFYNEPTLVNTR